MAPVPSVVSFVDLIFHHALALPEKPAIVLADRIVTYDMLAQGILRVADRLKTLALPPGGLVCISLDSPIRHMIVAAALFRLGQPVIAVSRPEDLAALNLPVVAYLHGIGVPLIFGARQYVVSDAWFEGERRPVSASPPMGFASEQDICCVALSSGTTGRPKAISLTVKAFQQWVMNYYAMVGLGTWDRFLGLIGLNSSWGFTLAAHTLSGGRTLLWAPTPRDSLQLAALYAVDAMSATTNQLRELVLEQARTPVPLKLRTIVTGGSLLSRPLIAEARGRLCNSIVNIYGSTEAGGTAFAHADQLADADGATGFAAPWAELEIVDQHGVALPRGTDGIVRIRATCQGAPYPAGQANESFQDGWFYPGDVGRLTSGSLLVLSGRTSDIINIGGQKLAPELIEDMLRQHHAVADVAAFGAMGKDGVEEISVAVVSSEPVAKQHLIDWCGERGIPIAHVHMVDAIPKAESGKPQRDSLRQQIISG